MYGAPPEAGRKFPSAMEQVLPHVFNDGQYIISYVKLSIARIHCLKLKLEENRNTNLSSDRASTRYYEFLRLSTSK